MSIKAVIFDFGGVIVRTAERQLRHQWDERFGLPHGTVEETVFNSERGRAAQHGVYSESEHWLWLQEQWSLSDEEATQFRADFFGADVVDQKLMTYIRNLRPRFTTAIISNAMDGLRQDLDVVHGVADAFDLIVVSAEFGSMKPNPTIYEHTLTKLGISPADSVFIDDFQHNIVGARAVGMHGIHYPPSKNTDALIRELGELGVR
jgi:putative hydrolase of the HAD superfamily